VLIDHHHHHYIILLHFSTYRPPGHTGQLISFGCTAAARVLSCGHSHAAPQAQRSAVRSGAAARSGGRNAGARYCFQAEIRDAAPGPNYCINLNSRPHVRGAKNQQTIEGVRPNRALTFSQAEVLQFSSPSSTAREATGQKSPSPAPTLIQGTPRPKGTPGR